MTIYCEKLVKCGHCQKMTKQVVCYSSSSFGYKHLDTRPAGEMSETIYTWMQLCPYCFYVSFDLTTPITPEIKRCISSQTYLKLTQIQEHNNIRRYRLSAHIEHCLGNYQTAGLYALYGAWMSDDQHLKGDTLRNQVVDLFSISLIKDKLSPIQRIFIYLICVDVLRVSGRFECSKKWINDGLETLKSLDLLPSESNYVTQIFNYQQKLVSLMDHSIHTTEGIEGTAGTAGTPM
jgi:hypothetical protein